MLTRIFGISWFDRTKSKMIVIVNTWLVIALEIELNMDEEHAPGLIIIEDRIGETPIPHFP